MSAQPKEDNKKKIVILDNPPIDPKMETIIMLEDSPPNRKILASILTKLGFQVLSGEDGEKGIALLEKCFEHEVNIVCLVSDIMMPNRDGLSFLAHVRELEKTKKMPFVLVTAAPDKDNVLEARRLNVNGYLLKPFSMEKIRAKLMELFPNRKFPLVKVL